MRRFAARFRPSMAAPLACTGLRPCSPSPKPLRDSDVADLVSAMEKDPELIKAFVNSMPAEARRRLVVTGAAWEWFGSESVASEVTKADSNKDRAICPKDFDKWFEEALRRKAAPTSEAEQAQAADTAAAAAGKAASVVPFAALALVALEAGLPFVGFGFLDNATMIVAGDAIDRTLGFWLNCSVMASAAMGNIVSGCMGMQVHGFVEKLVQKLNLPIPPLTEEQRRSQRVFMAGHIGGTLGIFTGLSLGLVPLFFIKDEDEKTEQRAFHQLDTNADGRVSETELTRVLADLGLPLPQASAHAVLEKYGSDGKLNFEQFRALCEHVRQNPRKVIGEIAAAA